MVNNKIGEIELDKKEKEMKKLIASEIETSKLKENQCKGGKTKWVAERSTAMKLTHLLMKEDNMDFGTASRISWQFVREERCKPCSFEEENIEEENNSNNDNNIEIIEEKK